MSRTNRHWTDGDTYLCFGALVFGCWLVILWQASDPANWLEIRETQMERVVGH